MSSANLDRIHAGRAMEALRNGVPNRDAVRVLGTWQQDVEERFEERLREARDSLSADHQHPGLLISGGFGHGKSHLLEHLQERALSANFMCSRVVISKETPLHDLGKMFLAAAGSAELPAGNGGAIAELAELLNPESDAYARLSTWANDPDSGVSAIFPASLFVHANLPHDPEIRNHMVSFWSGEPLPMAYLRHGLRQSGGSSIYAVRAVRARQLAAERFAFVARLAMGTGLAGWVILIDEVELIGRYSPLQRGRSYAELARWVGAQVSPGFGGLTAVAAITDDFDINVLQEKGDLDSIGPRLRSKGTEEMEEIAARAEAGMQLLQRQAMPLSPPTEEVLRHAHDRLRQVHSTAYGWSAPAVELGELALRRPMRAFVRRWINEWDLRRLHPGAMLDTEEEEMTQSYGVVPELDEAVDGPDGLGPAPPPYRLTEGPH